MKKLLIILSLSLIAAFFFCPHAFAQANVQTSPNCGAADDGITHMPTDWGTRTAPGKGNSYLDPLAQLVSGTATDCRVWQVTNSAGDLPSGGGLFCPETVEYSPIGPLFNADNGFVIVTQSGCGTHWFVFNVSSVTKASGTPPTSTTFTMEIDPSHMPSDLNNDDSPVWDPTNPNVFYYCAGNTFKKATITGVNTLTTTLLYTFPAYSQIGTVNYPGLSYDGTTINLVGMPSTGFYTIFALNINTGAVGDAFLTSCAVNGSIGQQPGGDCIHKTQISADKHLMMDFNGGSSTGQFLSNGTSEVQVWPGGRSAHHTSGFLQDGTTAVWYSIGDASGNNLNNPCSTNVGSIYLRESDILGGGSAPFPEHCWFANYFVGGNSHLSFTVGPHQPWIAQSYEDGGSAASRCEFWFQANSGGTYCAPSTACVFGNNACVGSGAWTTYQGEMTLVPNDCVGNTGGTAGCAAGASGRGAFRMIFLYSASQENFADQPEANISSDGRWAVISQTLAYNITGCPATINFAQGFGARGCPDVYLVGPLFNAGTGPAVSLSPTSLSFGSQVVSTTSAQQVVTLTNTGTATLTISSIALTTGTQFAFATPGSGSDCRTVGTVAASGTCNIAVTFTPLSAGAQSDTVSIADNAAGSPHTFGVSGTGVAVGGGSTMNGSFSINGGMVSN